MKVIKMQDGKGTVKLTYGQYWIIKLYLDSDVLELEQLYKDAEDAGNEDEKHVYGYCLRSLKDALNALLLVEWKCEEVE